MVAKKAKEKPKAAPKKMGRPTDYNSNLATKICEAVAITTDGLDKVCARNIGFPEASTIYKWRIKHPDFAQKYEDAKRNQAELLATEILKIADDDSQDTMINEMTGNVVQNSEFIARSRLRVDARKWIASKLLPKVYGDKVQNETTITVKHEDLLKELE